MNVTMEAGTLRFEDRHGDIFEMPANKLNIRQTPVVAVPSGWEEKCHACGDCCEYRYSEEGEIHGTGFYCQHFDTETRLCTVYENRHTVEGGCGQITPDNVQALGLPKHCGLLK